MTHPCSCDLSRRHFLTTATLGSATLWLGGLDQLLAGSRPATETPDEAVKRLKEGNERFKNGTPHHLHMTKERFLETYREDQNPFATVIGCSDSRVPVEELFDQGVGDLFTIRIAGNVINNDVTASSEYGGAYLETRLIVVMGHTRCGAVSAVLEGGELIGNIPKLVDNIFPAVQRSKAKGLAGDALLNDAIRENVKQSIHDLRMRSQEISKLETAGKVKIVGAVYHLENGQVEWM
jgi:carbonic anhydrase